MVRDPTRPDTGPEKSIAMRAGSASGVKNVQMIMIGAFGALSMRTANRHLLHFLACLLVSIHSSGFKKRCEIRASTNDSVSGSEMQRMLLNTPFWGFGDFSVWTGSF